jgi:hypothetical protein
MMLEMAEEAALPGPLRFTRVLEVEVHILAFVAGVGEIFVEKDVSFGGLMRMESEIGETKETKRLTGWSQRLIIERWICTFGHG